MRAMFSYCSNLTSLGLSSFDTSNVTEMNEMFAGCNKLTSLDLSAFNTSNVTEMRYMFENCRALVSIYVSTGWDTSNAITSDMFYGCGTSSVTYI